MKIFQLTWTWWEDYYHYLLIHPTKTKEEFEADCIRAYRESGEEYLDKCEKELTWVGANEWVEYTYKKLLEYGYQEAEVANFGTWGDYIVDYEDEDTDSDFKKIVGKELYQRASAINKKVDADIHKDIK